jgi:hypothetical protein
MRQQGLFHRKERNMRNTSYIVERENMLTGKNLVRFFPDSESMNLYLSRALEGARILKDAVRGNFRFVDFVDETGLHSIIVRPADA